MAGKIQVMIVDDSAVVRETMRQILDGDPGIEVIATASDPIIAAKKLETLEPDVLTLDVEMPRMDGITFLRKLMAQRPIPVVICSSQAGAGSMNALRALEYGAVDIIEKPKMGTKQFLEESKVRICDAVKAARLARIKKHSGTESISVPQPKHDASVVLDLPQGGRHTIETTEKVVVIGASTGGTEALRILLEGLPLDAPGTVVVQHMPEHFTASFAKRLNELCKVTVKEAERNDSVVRGQVLIAPGNRHVLLKRSGARYYVEVKDGPLVSRHRPSVDVLFRSAARYAGPNAIGVIMTGMGDDGARGMLEMKEAGSYNIGQDEQTCVVYGMPQEAFKRGAVDKQLPLGAIAAGILRVAGEKT